MPIQGILVGRDAVAYYNINLALKLDGNTVTPMFWLNDSGTFEATNIMDLTENIDSDMADSTTRAEAKAGWSAEIAVLKTGQVQFDFRWEPSDTFTANMITAWDNQEAITLAILDQDKATSGAQGLIANFSVSLSKQENLRDIQKASATVSVATFPEWYKVP